MRPGGRRDLRREVVQEIRDGVEVSVAARGGRRRGPRARPARSHHSPGVSCGNGIMAFTSVNDATAAASHTIAAVALPATGQPTARRSDRRSVDHPAGVFDEAGGLVVTGQVDRDGGVARGFEVRHHAMPVPGGTARARDQDEGARGLRRDSVVVAPLAARFGGQQVIAAARRSV